MDIPSGFTIFGPVGTGVEPGSSSGEFGRVVQYVNPGSGCNRFIGGAPVNPCGLVVVYLDYT